MRSSKISILLNFIPLILVNILYNVDHEFQLICIYIVIYVLRLIIKIFSPQLVKIEWLIFLYKISLLIYIWKRGYFGTHLLISISYYLLIFLLIVFIIESIFQLRKTYKIIKTESIENKKLYSNINPQNFNQEIKIVENTVEIKRKVIQEKIKKDKTDYGDIDLFE